MYLSKFNEPSAYLFSIMMNSKLRILLILHFMCSNTCTEQLINYTVNQSSEGRDCRKTV